MTPIIISMLSATSVSVRGTVATSPPACICDVNAEQKNAD